LADLTSQQLYVLGDSVYLLSNPGTWGAAQAEAKAYRGNLVTINDPKEQMFLAGLFAGNTPWIGINDAATEGIFQWADGSSLFTSWAGGKPDNSSGGDYAYIWTDNEWYMTSQNDQRAGIIEITNPATPILIIEDLGIVEPSKGTKQAQFKVRLIGSSAKPISVDYATVEDTALPGINYTPKNGSLIFNPGEKEKVISITIRNDREKLSGKRFFLSLDKSVNAIIGDNQSIAMIREASDAVTFAGSTYLLSKAGSWGEGQVEARSYGGNIVTINNALESAFLAGVYANQTPWIGINDAGIEAGTDQTKFQWFNGVSAYTNWAGGTVDNSDGGDYAYLWQNSEWYVAGQSEERTSIIEIPYPFRGRDSSEQTSLRLKP
jgi:hypothetical protein